MKKAVTVFVVSLLLVMGVQGFAQMEETGSSVIDQDWFEWCLHAGYSNAWVFTEYSQDGITLPVPLWAQDNFFIYNYDGTGFFVFGEVEKDTTDFITTDAFTWRLEGDILWLDGFDSMVQGGSIAHRIVEFDDDYFLIEREQQVGGKTVTYQMVYERMVRPNPYASVENQALTGGLTKIWIVSMVEIAGEIIELPEWATDDFFVFFTDGSAYYTYGEVLENPQAGIHTDKYYWEITDNGSKMWEYASDLALGITGAAQIYVLNTQLFAYERTYTIDGEIVLAKVTLVPLLE